MRLKLEQPITDIYVTIITVVCKHSRSYIINCSHHQFKTYMPLWPDVSYSHTEGNKLLPKSPYEYPISRIPPYTNHENCSTKMIQKISIQNAEIQFKKYTEVQHKQHKSHLTATIQSHSKEFYENWSYIRFHYTLLEKPS
jgi:hypothetical protein